MQKNFHAAVSISALGVLPVRQFVCPSVPYGRASNSKTKTKRCWETTIGVHIHYSRSDQWANFYLKLSNATGTRGAGDHEEQGGSLVLEGNQWRRGRSHPPPPKFWAVRKSSSCQIFFRRKMQTLKLKNSYFGKFRVKIKILSTHGLLCRTFAAVCRNSVEQFSVSVGKLQ